MRRARISDRAPRAPRGVLAALAALAAGLVVLAAPVGLAAQLPGAQRPQATEGARPNQPGDVLVPGAVIESFDLKGKRVFMAPSLAGPAQLPGGLQARARHTAETQEWVRKRYNATIATPEEAIRCRDAERPETCSLGGNGVLFQFLAPQAISNGILPVQAVIYHDGKGRGGQLLREAWEFDLVQRPGVGWVVLRKRMVGAAQGPR
jgi:hypothetical protein